MIITLKGADFSGSNIGTLSSWRISRSLGTGATYEGPTSVDKDASLSATVTLAENYAVSSAGVTITMGGTTLSGAHSISGQVITITIANVTGNVLIKVPTVNTTTGEEDEPDTPDTPDTPTETTLIPLGEVSGVYVSGEKKYAQETSSKVVVYAVKPNATYSISVQKNEGAADNNANLIFAPVTDIDNIYAEQTPKFASGYTDRVVVMSTNTQNVLDYQFITPSDCNYLVCSSHKSGSTYTIETDSDNIDNIMLTAHSEVTGLFIGSDQTYAGSEPTSKVTIFEVRPNTTYKLSVWKVDSNESHANLIFAPVTAIDNISAEQTPKFASGYTERVVEMSTNSKNVLDYQFITPSDCNYLVLSKHQSGCLHRVVQEG